MIEDNSFLKSAQQNSQKVHKIYYKELKKFMNLFTDWYNNSPQYMLGGYSPIEFREIFK